MPALVEDQISNVTVKVVTPPPLPPLPPMPQESLEPTFYVYGGTHPIVDDTVTKLVNVVEKKQHLRECLLKVHGDGLNVANSSSNPTPVPLPPPPPGVFSSETEYLTTAMPGIKLAAASGDTPAYVNVPTGVLIKPTASIISTPYFPKDPDRVKNGVLGNSKTNDPARTTYLWRSLNPIADTRTRTVTDALQPRPDGAVEMIPQPRTENNPRNPVYLTPHVFEGSRIRNGKNLNSFALMFGIVPGCCDATSDPQNWRITIAFGEVTIIIDEGSSQIEVKIGDTEPLKVTISPGSGARTTHHFGERPYTLTFIPVWNGLLISDGPPGAPNWPDKVTYIQKDPKRSILTELNNLLWPEPTRADPRKVPMQLPTFDNGAALGDQVPAVVIGHDDSTKVKTGETLSVIYHRCGGMLKFIPVYFPEGLRAHLINRGAIVPTTIDINKLPLPLVVPPSSANGPRFTNVAEYNCLEGSATSFQVQTDGDADFVGAIGLPAGLTIETNRASIISYGLIYGTPRTNGEFAVLLRASRSTGTSYMKLMIKITPSANVVTENVFELDSPKNATVLPIFFYPDGRHLEVRAKKATLPTGENTPFDDVVVEYKRTETDYRLPIETWGYITYKKEETYFQFRNEDGFLTVNDVPEPRIRSFNISRSFDGTSGSITWDRYDPVTGLFTRPIQNAGSIRVYLDGGQDTTPGVVFTGLAIGNSESDQEGANEIEVPLSGREVKLTEEGGIRLINVPFFDGWEHSLVMQFLCNYGGVPLKNLSTPYRLPSSFNIQESIVDFTTGESVWNAMSEVGRLAGTLFFFDRFGDLVYIEVSKTSGVNWAYPDTQVQDYNDSPDFSTLRNSVVLSAMIADGKYSSLQLEEQFHNLQMTTPVLMSLRITTTPDFAWDKMMFYAINGVLPSQAEFNRIAIQIAKGVARPRATGKVTIPGNALIELLDTFNDNWVVTQISHTADTQTKKWTTTLSLELMVDPGVVGTATILPVGNIE